MIRDATESDLPELVAAMLRLQESHVSEFPEIYRPFESGDAVAHLRAQLSNPDSIVRVVLLDDRVVGHVVFLTRTMPETIFTRERRFGYIAQLEVEPGERGKGFGRLLLEECERIASSFHLDTLELNVLFCNVHAIALYHGFAFETSSVRMTRSV